MAFGKLMFVCNFFLLSCFSFYAFLFMEHLKIGSLNVNGLRDRKKQTLVSEYFNIKNIAVGFLQETHSNMSNESEWGLWRKGDYVLSHGSNVSAGVAILFHSTLKAKIVSRYHIEPGRLLLVRAEINNFHFLFVNMYAPNGGTERVILFEKLARGLIILLLQLYGIKWLY